MVSLLISFSTKFDIIGPSVLLLLLLLLLLLQPSSFCFLFSVFCFLSLATAAREVGRDHWSPLSREFPLSRERWKTTLGLRASFLVFPTSRFHNAAEDSVAFKISVSFYESSFHCSLCQQSLDGDTLTFPGETQNTFWILSLFTFLNAVQLQQ